MNNSNKPVTYTYSKTTYIPIITAYNVSVWKNSRIMSSCSNAQIILFTIQQLLFKITAAVPFKAFDLNVKTFFNSVEDN